MVPEPGDPRPDETQPYRMLIPGTVISHYKIIERIGAGGMGVVYQALDTRLDRHVALKFLPPHLLCDREARERFELEAKAASALSHANVTTIHEIDEVEGQCFIVMEYVDGKTLGQMVSEDRLAPEQILDFAIQIGTGLAAAHKQEVTHRDIKPENIKITPDGTVKIMDFGLAKLKDATRLTKPGTTLGTLPYMSPEQLQGKSTDHRSDIFSFGVVLYEMIAGRRPFKGETEGEIVYSILNETPEPLARYKAAMPDGFQRIVDKALSKDKDERYQHADDLVADLRHEKRLLQSTETLPVSGRVSESSPRNKLLRILLPALAVAVAVLLIFIFEPFRFEVGPRHEAAAQENSLAIMYFENMPDPEDMDKSARMITALLITDLSESEHMYVISRQRLYDILKFLGKEDLKSIDRTVASEVAEKAGVKWILTGSILQIEPNWVVTADISETASGKIVGTQRVVGEQGENIFSLVDRLSSAVKADLALPEAAGGEVDRPVADVTTHSAEAYRYYLEGLDYGWKFYWPEALESFSKAIEYDSTFAMAYYRLGGLSSGEDRLRYAAKALQYADDVGHKERYYLTGFHAYATGDYATAVAILEEAAEKYPDDKEIRFTLAVVYEDRLHLYERAIANFTKAIEIDPMYKIAYNALAYTYHHTGDFDRSIWAINKYIAIAPDEPNPYDTRGDLYAYNGNLDDAIASYRKALEIKPDFPGSAEKLGHMHLFKREYDQAESYYKQLASGADKQNRALGRLALALIPAHQGKFEEALRILDDGLAADRMDEYQGFYNAMKHGKKSEMYTIRKQADRAEPEAKLFCDIAGRAFPYDVVSYRPIHVLRLARAGRFDKADEVVEALRNDIEASGQTGLLNNYWNAQAYIELARGNWPEAVSCFERAIEIDPTPTFHADIRRGQAYLEAGRLADAVAVLEDAMGRYDDNRAYNPAFSVRTHYSLGRAYEGSGWTEKANGQYEEFLNIWKDADPGVPEIEDARRRLAHLKGTS